jgi:zinc transport system permease protein
MIQELFELFQYQFFIYAIIAAIIASISCGVIGSYIVSRRMVFISGGITHASFGGIGLGYFIGINPVFGAAVFAVLVAIAMEFFTKKMNVRQDSAIGIFWSFGMAIGIIFIYLSPGYAPNLLSYLFGSILSVAFNELIFMGAITLLLLVFFSLFYKLILFIAFDEEFARSQNAPVNTINYAIIIFIALIIVINIRVVGIILVISLLTIPQTIANIFTQNFRKMVVYSSIIGLLAALTGLFSAYFLEIPSGASIIFTLVVFYIVIKSISYFFKKTMA